VIEMPSDERPAVLIQGDCLEVLRELSPGMVDAVVTDPPYGIGENSRKVASRGKLAKAKDYGHFDWDAKPCSPEILCEIRRVSQMQIIFGGNYFELPATSCWLVWDKLNGTNDFADCELAWTNLKKAVRRIQYRWNGMIRDGNDVRVHPTQKPEAVMRWCLGHLPADADIILDPFMGSGTTGVACIQTGRKFIGIELDPKYFAIAQKRINDAMGVGGLFPPVKPATVELFA
jgi:DNA modification methylase